MSESDIKVKGTHQIQATFMMEPNRKTVVVCHQCHTQITYGRYDGPKLI